MSRRPDPVRGAGRASGPPATRVTLRPAAAADCHRIWLWRNDEATRLASLDSAPISLETHQLWFQESLRRPDRKIYIILSDGQEAGVARLDVAGVRGTVNIHLAPECRGRGMGPSALRALEGIAFGPLGLTRMEAEVKAGNAASLSAFQKAGFTLAGSGLMLSLVKVRRED